MALAIAFAMGSAWSVVVAIVEPGIVGSHAAIYAEAARAWLSGGDPWQVGPSLVVFAGPPPMLLPFAPFAFLPGDVTRFTWVVIDVAIAALTLRRLALPAHWLAFPPLFEAIVLGHPEVLVLGLLVLGGAASGLAAVVKAYAALPLLAERRWRAIGVAAAVALVTIPILPWTTFLEQLPEVSANLARQDVGDSTFGQPLLMAIGAIALLALGPRRALWLAVPVLWPYAQPIYKAMTVPVLPPIVALAWATSIPGFTLGGIIAYAVLTVIDPRRALPRWLHDGIRPVATWPDGAAAGAGRAPVVGPTRAAGGSG